MMNWVLNLYVSTNLYSDFKARHQCLRAPSTNMMASSGKGKGVSQAPSGAQMLEVVDVMAQMMVRP
jgi:hypothetical protein